MSVGQHCMVQGWIASGMPHPLIAPEKNDGWGRMRAGFDKAAEAIRAAKPDLLLLYSTQWPSVIGHQIQADPKPVWHHVDQEWHDLGDLPYELRIDAEFGEVYESTARERGLHARRVAYEGFPVDTGSVSVLKLLNPDNAIPASIVSCNMYADRAETLVLGKAARDAIERSGRKTVAIAVTNLSNRLFTHSIDPAEDRISSDKDDEWNRKLLEFLSEGRLEDVSQLARQFTKEAHADNKLKAIWWLAALMGQHNRYAGDVLSYEAIYGSGAALVSLTPTAKAAQDQEFDEDDVEFFGGERKVLGGDGEASGSEADGASEMAMERARSENATSVSSDTTQTSDSITQASDGRAQTGGTEVMANAAPKPVGAYPHARREGEWLFLSGVGPRQVGTDEIPGGPVWNAAGETQDYDVKAQTKAVIENVRLVLEASGASLSNVIDVTVFLVDMKRDFKDFNAVYAETFAGINATRTTVEVGSLPTPIAVEFKVVARLSV